MRVHRCLRVAACALWLTGSGCTALREIPRGEYAALPQREHVRVVTSDGLLYEFDHATFAADSIVGYKRRDVSSRVEEYATLGLPLESVTHLATRQIDWMRTGLVGGLTLLVVLVGAYGASQASSDGGGSGGGGGKPPPS